MDILAGPLTLFIWLAAMAAGGVAFHKTKRAGDTWRIGMRILFGVMVALSVWSVVSYALWLAGIPLKIGTIKDGRMDEVWWLPGLTVIWATLTYRSLK